ncbi:homoserine dehydrogenase [Georgenia satyanarayanai]|uniref:homoserine dehydrogenase n=1 Tax=Georgenia satyanarayanai TaxID=860221 RepID=UPI00203FAED5|nr:homoserine dehydrogenase [Georgenia satyanarayanai]MCM3660596.1 homoserine dehydrogenase [Georgenia satyanarayanai]
MSERALRVAVLGCGTVGTEVVRLLTEQAGDLTARTGARLEVVGIAVRDTTVPRADVVDTRLLTTDATGLVRDADLVIELMGGIEPARSLVLEAISAGAGVVTANKALLAAHGPELYEAAEERGVDLYFEAAVAGAVPVVRGVRESFAGDHVRRVVGIVNGTTNFILDEMTSRGVGFGEALADAQALGYAEADPTADIDGHDAAAKIAILASLAFHTRVSIDDVPVEGIRYVTAGDVEAATRGHHVIKLLAVAERRTTAAGEGISVRVHPALLPREHPLAAVHGAYNAVVVDTEAAGRLMFYGQGAGGAPTASAVLGDVVAAGRNRVSGGRGPAESRYADLPLLGGDEVTTQFQLRLEVADVPGVLAQIAGTFGEKGLSIQTVTQEQAHAADGAAVLVVVTHRASEAALAATADAVARIPSVKRVLAVTRVEDV